jgi:hypothetical protein
MLDRDIVKKIRSNIHGACGRPDRGILKALKSPDGSFYPDNMKRLGIWYRSLPADAQTLVDQLVVEVADLSIFSLFIILDGASLIEKGVFFELVVHDENGSRVITSGSSNYKGEYLHNLFKDVLQDENC